MTALSASKALLVVVFVLASIAGAGLLLVTQAEAGVSASSAPLLSAMLEWATSGWGYVFAAIVFGRGSIWGIRKARISQAAKETGQNPRTIGRMADEIQTTDGTNRAIIFGDDSLDAARERIREAFGGHDDRISFDDVSDVDDQEPESSAVALPVPVDESDPPATTNDVDEPEGGDGEEPSNAERFKLWWMDLATGLRTDDIIWKLLVPAGLVFVLELILVQFWVQWWLYPSLLASGLLAGVGAYQADLWLRDRRLASLRQDRRGETWEEIAVLVKTVEADNMTGHMGFLAGWTYASPDREELVDTLATQALERSYGYHPSPTLEERYAWCLDRYLLNFDGWRENMGKPQVMDRLINESSTPRTACSRRGSSPSASSNTIVDTPGRGFGMSGWVRPRSRCGVLRGARAEHVRRGRVHGRGPGRRSRSNGRPGSHRDAAAGRRETPGQLLRPLPDPADAGSVRASRHRFRRLPPLISASKWTLAVVRMLDSGFSRIYCFCVGAQVAKLSNNYPPLTSVWPPVTPSLSKIFVRLPPPCRR